MRQIRRGLFETNSSSTHSLTICDKDTYERWKNGELLFDEYSKEFSTKEEIKKLNPDLPEDEYTDVDIYTYNEFSKYMRYYERFEKDYRTPKGEEIVAFGYYGYDG